MKVESGKFFKTVVMLVCASIALHFPLSILHPLQAQEPVAPVTRWMATVDSATQQIVLSWSPSADSATMGYHICTGNPCLDYDTVFGRFDTSSICVGHSPLEQHTYRLHVFDSAYNVSELTPSFGNVVLSADVPDCENVVSARWTPYEGLPSGQPTYILQTRLEPLDTSFTNHYTTQHSTQLEYTFDIPEAVTRVWLRVMVNVNNGLYPLSNIVMVERRTIDTASVVDISGIAYDSANCSIALNLVTDSDFPYTLYRSVDGTPWREVATVGGTSYVDSSINPYDSLYCYRLGVRDACGLNERFSSERCVVVPDPPTPAIAIPNAIVAGDAENGTFRPVVRGLTGDIYELDIFNRYGLPVFHSDNPTEGWTPTADTPQGAYAYLLRCRYNTGKIKSYAGTIIVIK